MNKGDLELITASHLAQWPETKSRDAESHFPELVRRLLLETPEASEISVPIKDGVNKRGYDGKATIKEPTKLLPAGRLGFELGTGKDVDTKAKTDYGNRNKENASTHEVEVFVFITPRRWPKKEDWITKQQNDSNFKQVTALDADDLELWLQLAPNTHVWISEWLGLNPRDAATPEKWWNDFSRSTSPELPLELFTAGRDKEAKQLRQLVRGEPQSIRIRSEWEDDALGFFAATFAEQFEADLGHTLTTIIRSAEVWERVTAQRGNGILIPLFDRPDIDRAIHSGRHVVEVLNSNTAQHKKNNDIKLPRLDLYHAEHIFCLEGLEWRQAKYLARLARQSLPELMREIALSSPNPTWLEPPIDSNLVALTLAGSWDGKNPEDLEIISELANIPSDSNKLENFIFKMTQGHDPAISKVGEVHTLVSPRRVLLKLDNGIRLSLASRWADIASRVLLKSDSLEGITPSQRTTTRKEEQRACSPILRRGLATSLALAGSIRLSDDSNSDIPNVTNTAKQVVGKILKQAISDKNGHTWLEIADILPLLAEAAPDIFLSKFEDGLKSDKPSVVQLLQTVNDSLGSDFPSNKHPLLEALQTLCWLREYSIKAVQSLTKVAAKFPQDTLLIESILSILYSWFRNVSANQETRLEAVKACRSINALFSFKLITRLCTDTNSIKIPLNEPRYQLQKFDHKEVQQSEWAAFISKVINIAITWAEKDHSILPWLTEAITNGSPEDVSPEDLNSFIKLLEAKISSDELEEDIRIAIFEKAHDFAVKYKPFHDSELNARKLQYARIAELASSLEPSDDPRRFTYLFARNPELPQCNSTFDKNYDDLLDKEQRNALNELFNQPGGWERLVVVTKRAEDPEAVGYALAKYERSDIVDTMLGWLKSENDQMREAASIWAKHYLRINGPDALHHILERGDLTGRSRKLFILNIPTESEFWDVLHDFPHDEKIFWGEADFTLTTKEDSIQAIEFLLKRDRAWAAMDIADNLVLDIAVNQEHQEEKDVVLYSKLFTSILWSIIKQRTDLYEFSNSIDGPLRFDRYRNGAHRLLDYLKEKSTHITEMAELEFAYLGFLLEVREPRALYQVLISKPSFFVELVRLAHEGKQEPLGRNDRIELKVENASLVLQEWPGLPVEKEDDTFDEENIRHWIEQVRRQLRDSNYANNGDFFIGKFLAHTPYDSDRIWPLEFIRDLIEEIDSEHFNKGIYSGRISIENGLCIDSAELAKIYGTSVNAVQAEWPRTARILRRIAEHYEEEARRWDERAEISQDLD